MENQYYNKICLYKLPKEEMKLDLKTIMHPGLLKYLDTPILAQEVPLNTIRKAVYPMRSLDVREKQLNLSLKINKLRLKMKLKKSGCKITMTLDFIICLHSEMFM